MSQPARASLFTYIFLFCFYALDYSGSVLSCQDIEGPLIQIIFIAFFGNISVPMKYKHGTYKIAIWKESIMSSLAISNQKANQLKGHACLTQGKDYLQLICKKSMFWKNSFVAEKPFFYVI